jgi:hypothetical protein
VSFSEPGRDDGSLPPVNIVIPDDARELDRDVLAYRRELRARRRRQRLLRLFRPLRLLGFGGHAAIIPLLAACLAISLVGGALLSVATMNPASAPTLAPQPSAQASVVPADISPLPAGAVKLGSRTVPVRSLVSSAIAIIPANCGCGTALGRLAAQAVTARVSLYFAGAGSVIPQLPALVTRYGDGWAVAAADATGVLSDKYRPVGLTVLLVYKDATAATVRNLTGNFQLAQALGKLQLDGASLGKA